MAQLLKHYFFNRDTKTYSVDNKFGLMVPDIKGLEIIHNITDENDIPCCLSTCPEYFEYSSTVSAERLQELESDPNITIISSDVSAEDETSYDVVYQEAYNLEETEGLSIIAQQEWDTIVDAYDARQLQKRLEVLRSVRDEILSSSDWVVVKSLEKGSVLSTSFKDWRQSLRDLPSEEIFPSELPPVHSEVGGDAKVLSAYVRWNEVTSIPMINDPITTAE
jgi:hypothetical protein